MERFVIYSVAAFELIIIAAFIAAVAVWIDVVIKGI